MCFQRIVLLMSQALFEYVSKFKNGVAHNTLKPILVKGQMMPSITFYCSHLSIYWYVYSEGNALYPLSLPTINNSLRNWDNKDIKKNICIASYLGMKPKDISDTVMEKEENNSSHVLRLPHLSLWLCSQLL